jgi:hypothetical protein
MIVPQETQNKIDSINAHQSVSLNESARAMGRKGGRAKTAAKLSACAKNARLSRGLVAQVAKHLHGTNLRSDDHRIIAIKRNLSNGTSGLELQRIAFLSSANGGPKTETNNLRSNEGLGSRQEAP